MASEGHFIREHRDGSGRITQEYRLPGGRIRYKSIPEPPRNPQFKTMRDIEREARERRERAERAEEEARKKEEMLLSDTTSIGGKHNNFSEYLSDDMARIHREAATKRAELQEQHEKAIEAAKLARTAGKNKLEQLQADVAEETANQVYRAAIKDLQQQTAEKVETVRKAYKSHVNEFYSVTGAKLDDDTIKLLKSGMKLTQSEIDGLFEKHSSNPAMLRYLSDYCEEHRIKVGDMAAVLGTRARSCGEHEQLQFDGIADMISRSVSDNDLLARKFGADEPFVHQFFETAANALDNIVLKPETGSDAAGDPGEGE